MQYCIVDYLPVGVVDVLIVALQERQEPLPLVAQPREKGPREHVERKAHARFVTNVRVLQRPPQVLERCSQRVSRSLLAVVYGSCRSDKGLFEHTCRVEFAPPPAPHRLRVARLVDGGVDLRRMFVYS